MGKQYKAICHTRCYWLETLWEIGEIYEGTFEPSKHFSADGKLDKPLPPPNPGDDTRSTREIRDILKSKFMVTKPQSWPRKKLWAALRDLETAESKDELTNPSDGVKRPGRPKAK